MSNDVIRGKILHPEMNMKLAEHFGFPYGLSFPELKKYSDMTFQERMEAAAKIGDMRIVKKMLEYGVAYLDEALRIAAEEGHEDIMNLLIENGASDFEDMMTSAVKGHHTELVFKLLQKYPEVYLGNAIEQACIRGYLDILDMLLEARNIVPNHGGIMSGMPFAAKNGHMNIIKRLIDYGVTDFRQSMVYAASGGRLDILNLLLSENEKLPRYKATNFDQIMAAAAEAGHLPIVQRMVEYGAENFKWALQMAEKNNHQNVIEYLKKLM